MILIFFSIEKMYNPRSVRLLSHLTSCTPTKSNLYLANSLATVVSVSGLYRILTFHVPNHISFSHCLRPAKGSVKVWGLCESFVTWQVLRWGGVSVAPNPQIGGQPLDRYPRQLIKYTRSCQLHWRPFLHPQPEDAPCRGDKGPLICDLCRMKRLKRTAI
jgi:hypothetical protein